MTRSYLSRIWPRAASIRIRLVLLGAAAIVPMLAMFVIASILQYRGERARAGERELDLARSMAATVERELSAGLAGIGALALSPRLQADDMAGFRTLAMRFMADKPPGSALILLDRSGRHLVNTIVPDGGTLPHRSADATAALTRVVFETGRPLISNLYPRAIGGGLIVTVDTPVLKQGGVAYDLSLVLPAARFQQILAEQRLPSGWVVSILDRNNLNVARLPGSDRFVGHGASLLLLPGLRSREEGVLHTVSLEGVPLLTAFSHSWPSGWSVAIGQPEADLRLDLLRSVALLLGAGALALLLGTVVAVLLGQRILRPIRALARFAAAPGAAPVGTLGLLEADAVAAALRHSHDERQAAMSALVALNDELEARVRVETTRRVQAQEQLAQAQRMEALGQLAGGIAHDFNNVLQAVSGGLSLIERRADDAEKVRRLAAMASGAAARGASITGRLLSFARRGELSATAVPAMTLLEGLRDMLMHTLGSAIEVRVEVAQPTPDLLADRAQLETVLINLAVNARDAMPDGGTLLLSAAAEEIEAATGFGLAAGAYLHLTLSDTGTGMTQEVLARACEPFFTTKEPGHGTGLGLPMARGFCQQSGGGFRVDSTPGQGTQVHLWFPQALAHAEAPPPQAASALPHEAAAPMRILLVDDDPMVREVMAGDLEARGFLVTTAAEARAALALLDGGLDTELLITDYAMPAMNGLALIHAVRQLRPALPALLMTGYAEAGTQAAIGAEDRLTVLLRKPIAGEDLAARAAALRRAR